MEFLAVTSFEMKTTREINPEFEFPVALLLTLAGGYLDAFTWVGHGHVFANAQTGNVVLLGIDVATGQGVQAIRHLIPIAAFIVGVTLANAVKVFGPWRDRTAAALFSLGCEIALLAVIACLPSGFPDLPIVLGIAFLAAYQCSSFNKLESWPFNSVMTTGNLKRATEALFIGITKRDGKSALHEAFCFAAVCVTFCIGAGLGAAGTAALHNAAAAGPALILLAALLICLKKSHAARRI